MKHMLYLLTIILFVLISYRGVAQQYQNTTVTPHINVVINESENYIYTSSFLLAWKMLENDILRSNVRVKENIPLVNQLNNSKPASINEQHSVNLAGFVKSGIDIKITNELKRKFGKTIDLLEYTDDPSNIICYSYFDKKIKFKTKFESFEQLFPFFSGGKPYDVKCFGIWTVGTSLHHKGIRELVKVYDRDMKDFIISVSNPDENDEIIIAAITPSQTLSKTIEKTIARIKKSEPTPLVENDRLVIPLVTIIANKKYSELYGVHLANKGFESYFFAEAMQDINFELNESGAFADSEAKIILKKGPGPRTMMINRPFLLMMMEKTADAPYLAAWIANPELLVQTK